MSSSKITKESIWDRLKNIGGDVVDKAARAKEKIQERK